MTGLEKIVKEILDEAQAEAGETLAKAQAEAQKILDDAKEERDAKAARAAADADKTVADIEAARESAMALQRRQRLLAAKQALLEETLQKALDSLYALPVDAYFDLLVRLAAGAAQPGNGEMYLNEQDKKRMPAGFEQKLAAALPQGTSLKIADVTRPMDGGFVLKYGDIEENCSFRAIFDLRADAFSDLVRDTLFTD